jgi:hypothetical protein
VIKKVEKIQNPDGYVNGFYEDVNIETFIVRLLNEMVIKYYCTCDERRRRWVEDVFGILVDPIAKHFHMVKKQEKPLVEYAIDDCTTYYKFKLEDYYQEYVNKSPETYRSVQNCILNLIKYDEWCGTKKRMRIGRYMFNLNMYTFDRGSNKNTILPMEDQLHQYVVKEIFISAILPDKGPLCQRVRVFDTLIEKLPELNNNDCIYITDSFMNCKNIIHVEMGHAVTDKVVELDVRGLTIFYKIVSISGNKMEIIVEANINPVQTSAPPSV